MNAHPTPPQIDSALWPAWHEACHALGVTVDAATQERLTQFYTLLIEANQVMNLTRITAPEDFLYRHLLDSLTLSPHIPANAFLVDVGSGPGFPAIPLAIIRPDITVVAVESTVKKARFIGSVGEALGLSNLRCESDRAETLAHDRNFRAKADVVTARAVASLPVLLELCIPFLKVDGLFLAMKGLACEEEVAKSTRAFKMLGASVQSTQTFEHPRLEASRLLLITKFRPTLPDYPRAPGQPAKTPLL